jgi:hypothetical protein
VLVPEVDRVVDGHLCRGDVAEGTHFVARLVRWFLCGWSDRRGNWLIFILITSTTLAHALCATRLDRTFRFPRRWSLIIVRLGRGADRIGTKWRVECVVLFILTIQLQRVARDHL